MCRWKIQIRDLIKSNISDLIHLFMIDVYLISGTKTQRYIWWYHQKKKKKEKEKGKREMKKKRKVYDTYPRTKHFPNYYDKMLIVSL